MSFFFPFSFYFIHMSCHLSQNTIDFYFKAIFICYFKWEYFTYSASAILSNTEKYKDNF